MTNRPVEFLCLAAVILAVFGCQVEDTPVSGRVFLDLRPVSGVEIQFRPRGNPKAKPVTVVVEGGLFEIPSTRLPPGEYDLAFLPADANAKETIESIERGRGLPSLKAFVPKIYERSGTIKATISEDKSQRLTFHLVSRNQNSEP